MTAALAVRRGALYFDRGVYDHYFAPLSGIVLLREADDMLVLPVRVAGAGGYLIKIRNSAGDRVVDAIDFFRSHGVDDALAIDLSAVWQAARGALVASRVFAAIAPQSACK